MNNKKLLSFILLFLSISQVWAQTTITGTVTGIQDGSPLPGVSIVLFGTSKGTITNSEGKYQIQVPDEKAVLVFSFTGFVKKTVEVGNQTTVNVVLEEEVASLEEIVISALGIEKEKNTVGYATTKIKGEELIEARENNFVHTLAGKIPGVQINRTAGGPASSTRVIIRGITSLDGNNQPLYVVDGIPIDNSNLGSASQFGGKDLGDGIGDINPDDIESVNVLRGTAATALYGIRGQHGVIIINTKKGKAQKGIGVEINSNIVASQVVFPYNDYQNEFGSGADFDGSGVFRAPQNINEARSVAIFSAWGGRLDGSTAVGIDGEEYAYVAQDLSERYKKFFETGLTTTNTVALSGGNENHTFRFSASYMNNDDIIPESGMERYNFTLRSTSKFGERLTADVKLNYVRQNVDNRPSLSDTPENPGYILSRLGPDIDIDILREYEDVNGDYIDYFFTPFANNPWWGVFEQPNDDERNRVIGFINLTYQITDWLTIQGRTGIDRYNLEATDIDGFGTPYVTGGRISQTNYLIEERNSDFLITFNKIFGDIEVTSTLGGSRLDQESSFESLRGENFADPTFTRFSGTEIRNSNEGVNNRRRLNSLYATAQLGYKDYLYLEISARNDWSSYLPSNNNSFFYPSVSASFVVSEALQLPDWTNYAKIRASWAQVGDDGGLFNALNTNYSFNTVGNIPVADIANGSVPNPNISPNTTTGIEFGVEASFLEDRLSIDFSWYRQTTKDQIISANISNTSGYGRFITNDGELRNTGIEFLISGTPIKVGDFNWEATFNFSKNNNEVISVGKDEEGNPIPFLNIGASSRFLGIQIQAIPGEPYGQIVGLPYLRDAEGQIYHDANGLPMRDSEARVLGNGNPDWIGGLTNTFNYKGISLSFLIDIQQGGDLYSQTNVFALFQGLSSATLEGREDGIIGQGINTDGEPNTVTADGRSYWRRQAVIPESSVFNATFISLRQASLGYSLPETLVRKNAYSILKDFTGSQKLILSQE